MARPKLHSRPRKLNLSVDSAVKNKLIRVASSRGQSVSALVGKIAVELPEPETK